MKKSIRKIERRTHGRDTGADNIDGSGNELNNIINGNDGTNLLLGGAGDIYVDAAAANDPMLLAA